MAIIPQPTVVSLLQLKLNVVGWAAGIDTQISKVPTLVALSLPHILTHTVEPGISPLIFKKGINALALELSSHNNCVKPAQLVPLYTAIPASLIVPALVSISIEPVAGIVT